MSVILFLILLSIAFAVAFLAAFIWAVRSGQYEDTCTPSMRLLADEPVGVVGRRDGLPPSRSERRAPARRESAALQRAGHEPGAPVDQGAEATLSSLNRNQTNHEP